MAERRRPNVTNTNSPSGSFQLSTRSPGGRAEGIRTPRRWWLDIDQQEFHRFLKLIDAAVPKDMDLLLVLDNYATRKTPKVKEWLIRHPRLHLHFTPTNSSWMNLVDQRSL